MAVDIKIEGDLAIVQDGSGDPHHHEKGQCSFKFDGDILLFHAGKTFPIDLADVTIDGVAPGTKGATLTALKALFPDANSGTGGTGIDLGSGRISGCQIIWLGGLNFRVTAGSGKLNGIILPFTGDDITLDAADPDSPRIDLIGLELAPNESEFQVFVVTGAPAADPAEPGYDTTSQIRLSIVTIDAGATEPADVSVIPVYDENLGSGGGEWDVSGTASAYNKNSNSHPNSGTKSIAVTGMSNTQYLDFTAPAVFNIFTVNKLIIPIWLVNALNTQRNLSITLMNGNTVCSNTIGATSKGLNRTTTGSQQYIVFDFSDFNYTNTNINKIRISMSGTGNPAISFVLDNIRLQLGLIQQPIGSTATIYTSDGTLFSDRTINGNLKNLVINNLISFLMRDHNNRNQLYLSEVQASIQSTKTSGGDNIAGKFQTSSDDGVALMQCQDGINGINVSMQATVDGIIITRTDGVNPDIGMKMTKFGTKLTEMTKAQRNALTLDVTDLGYQIFQTDNTPGIRTWNGTHWVRFTETNDD